MARDSKIVNHPSGGKVWTGTTTSIKGTQRSTIVAVSGKAKRSGKR